MKCTSIALAAALCAAVPAFAADEMGQWYVTPQIGGVWTDNDRNVRDKDWVYGFAIGKHLSEAWSLEVNANLSKVSTPAPGNLDLYGGSLDLLRVFARSSAVSPFISVGAGALKADLNPGRNSTDFMAEAGVGLMWDLWSNSSGSRTFSLRPEIKARVDDAGAPGHYVDYLGLLGFQFSFGPAPVIEAPPPPPAPVAAVAPPPPPPAGPVDSDNDGVFDPQDQCPGTPPGVAVDAVGCPQKGSITLEGVTFEYNSAALTGDSKPVLDHVAEGMRKHPRLKVEMQGHTDSRGPDKYNLDLSERRANSVADYLVAAGVNRTQIVAKGFGESQPIADNSTDQGRAQNRRVVMVVLENPGEVKVEGEGKL